MMWRRMLLFFYSTPNIVGSALALGGLALLFAGLIKQHWQFIVMGLYGIGFLLTPRRATTAHTVMDDLKDPREALETLLAQMRDRLPADLNRKLQHLCATVLDILPRLQALDGGDFEEHTLRQTATRYLPDILDAYLRLPPAYARLHSLHNGKTARVLLGEQLDLLQREMDAIQANVLRRDTQALLANSEFLKRKFDTGTAFLR